MCETQLLLQLLGDPHEEEAARVWHMCKGKGVGNACSLHGGLFSVTSKGQGELTLGSSSGDIDHSGSLILLPSSHKTPRLCLAFHCVSMYLLPADAW